MIEVLVAVVITAIMLTLVMASYWTFLQTQQRMAVSRELQSEVRFAFNRLADAIRSHGLDYAEYPTGQCNDINRKLCLLQNTTPPSTTYVEFDPTTNILSMGPDSANTQPLISPTKFVVDNVQFEVSPTENPKVDLTQPQQQPKVTVFLRVFPRDERYQDLVIENQTTISSRQY